MTKKKTIKLVIFILIILLLLAFILNFLIDRPLFQKLKNSTIDNCHIYYFDVDTDKSYQINLKQEENEAFLAELKLILIKVKGVPRLFGSKFYSENSHIVARIKDEKYGGSYRWEIEIDQKEGVVSWHDNVTLMHYVVREHEEVYSELLTLIQKYDYFNAFE